jgi:hypothetical protein
MKRYSFATRIALGVVVALGLTGRALAGHAVPIKFDFRCFVDLNSGSISSTGFGTGGLGHWTSVEDIDNAVIDPVADRGVYSGTGTLVTGDGERLFFSFTTSWQLSTGEGTHLFTCTGGTGRYAGASGGGTGNCIVTADLATQTATCISVGSGILILPHR